MNPIRRSLARLVRPIRNRDGATLVFFGLMVVMLLSTFTIAVDVGLWLNTGSEAQRSADSAALAGAAEYWHRANNQTTMQIKPFAETKAREYAGLNYVGRTSIDPDSWALIESCADDPPPADPDADVTVISCSSQRRIGVWIRGNTAPLFARFIGRSELPVLRYAEARVVPAGGTDCLKPFAIPDLFRRGDLPASNQIYDPNDAANWTYQPGRGDTYGAWNGSNLTDPNGTGYGTTLRNGQTNSWSTQGYTRDNGRRVLIKAASTQGGQNNTDVEVQTNINPGIFLPVVLPGTTPNANCGLGSDNGVNGAAAFSRSICSCNNATVSIGDSLAIKTGNMTQASNTGVEGLMAQDTRPLQWRANNGGEVYDTRYPDQVVQASPRFIKVALYDPAEVSKPGKQYVNIRNIATIFLEGFQCQNPGNGNWTTNCGNNPQKHVVGRFMYYTQGSGVGTNEGALIKTLQLVR